MIDAPDGDSLRVETADPGTGPTLEQRSTRAVAEVRSAADQLGPQADAWKLALRDVHAHIFGEKTSEVDAVLNTDLIDAYRHLYDEMLRLSTLLDPDLCDPGRERPC